VFVRYCLDVMRIEKSVCDSIIGTLLNILGNTKNTVKAKLDLVKMRICKQLAPEQRGKTHIYCQHAILCLERRKLNYVSVFWD